MLATLFLLVARRRAIEFLWATPRGFTPSLGGGEPRRREDRGSNKQRGKRKLDRGRGGGKGKAVLSHAYILYVVL